jgi:hypothetical protein
MDHGTHGKSDLGAKIRTKKQAEENLDSPTMELSTLLRLSAKGVLSHEFSS